MLAHLYDFWSWCCMWLALTAYWLGVLWIACWIIAHHFFHPKGEDVKPPGGKDG